MPKFKIAIIALLAIVAVFQAVNYLKKYSGKTSPNINQSVPLSQNQNSSSGLEAQTNREGPVSVEVTPAELGQDKWKFEIFLNTHSIELDNDLTKSAVLVDASGKDYLPTDWEGDPPGGHHRSGILIFNAMNPKPDSVILKIREVGEIKERTFTWTISS